MTDVLDTEGEQVVFRTRYFDEKLEEGIRFQDYVQDVLYVDGIPVCNYASKWMAMRSENKLGAEIKRDGHFRRLTDVAFPTPSHEFALPSHLLSRVEGARVRKGTGLLFIETEEKSKAENDRWVSSGIYGRSWLFIIGDEWTFWIFSTKLLRAVASRDYRRTGAGTGTSKGFLLPVDDADKYCAQRYDIRDGKVYVSFGVERRQEETP